MPSAGIERTLRTLLRSANPIATDLLVAALESTDAELRCGAVRTLAMREDPAGHRALIERFHRLESDAQEALSDVPYRAPLSGRLLELIRPTTPKLARRAVEVAVAWEHFVALPATVEAALWPDNDLSGAFAQNAMSLAQCLERAMQDYDPQVIPGDEQERPEDPAFARRASVNALTVALKRYSEHRQQLLLDALLLLTPADEPALLRALHDDKHPAYEALLFALSTSRSRGVVKILASALGDLRAPLELLDIACDRCDAEGLGALLEVVGTPIGLRVRENCHRIDSFAWLGKERRGVLTQLSGRAQATAIQMAAASNAGRRDVDAALRLILEQGTTPGPLAAARAIERQPAHLTNEPLKMTLGSEDAAVVAAAAKLLRKKSYPGAIGVLVGLLEHTDLVVREAAGRSLRELSYSMFRDNKEKLDETVRRFVGGLVGKADPMASPTLRAELGAGAVERRLEAIEMIDLMGLANDLAVPLTACVRDEKDLGVRSEAARLLGQVQKSPEVVDALLEAAEAKAPGVHQAALASLLLLGVEHAAGVSS